MLGVPLKNYSLDLGYAWSALEELWPEHVRRYKPHVGHTLATPLTLSLSSCSFSAPITLPIPLFHMAQNRDEQRSCHGCECTHTVCADSIIKIW
jgi:hypothetical protein